MRTPSLAKSESYKVKFYLFSTTLGLAVCMLLACLYGTTEISFQQIVRLVMGQEKSAELNCIFWELRLPRVIIVILLGAAFAISGAVMQALTQNPLASPSLAGLNAGSTLGLLVAMLCLPAMSLEVGMIASAIGAAVGVMLVFAISMLARTNNSPAGLAISGLIVSMFLSSLTSAILHATSRGYELSFWTMGGLEATRWSHVNLLLPIFSSAFIFALVLSPALTALALGSETATGLGVNVLKIRALALIGVFILVGSAVAIAGPIGFVGLMVPHIAKRLIGFNYVKVIPLSALIGGLLLLVSDTLSRYLTSGALSAGVFTTLVGSIFFIYLALNAGRIRIRKVEAQK